MSPPPRTSSAAPVSRLEAFVLALLLLLHGWLALSATRHEGNTVDEMAHLMAGHAYWAVGDYRLQPENGVLPQLWEGLPGWLRHETLPPTDNPGWSQPNVWTLGHAYFHQLGNDLASLLYAGRAMNVVWSLATGLLVFGWTRSLFGRAGAWVATVFWAFCPTFLAHGALATSDMCMTFFMLACVGAYWRHLRTLDARSGALSALLLGLAFVAKYSAVLLPFMLAPLALLRLVAPAPFERAGMGQPRRAVVRRLLGSAAGHLVAVVVTIWAFHAFRFSPSPGHGWVNDYTRPWAVVLPSLGGPLAALLGRARAWHLLPDAYLYGFAFVVDLSHARGAFLNGHLSTTGWVWFFPYAFLVKTPLAILAGGVAAVISAAARWRRSGRQQLTTDLWRLAPLLSLFAVYWVFSLTSRLNIGQRHLLPVYPVVFIGLGVLGWAATRSRPIAWGGVGLLLGAQLAASFGIRPYYLAFFNGFAGGPAQGYRHLVDSSLDWGQELPRLADWLRDRHLPREGEPVYLAYFGTDDPAYYGIHATPLVPLLRIPPVSPWYALQTGTYCVSVTLLSQAYSPIREVWSPALEREYQDLHRLEPAFLDYAAHPEHRAHWEQGASAAKWEGLWKRYEQLRFTRLCYQLRAREPDAQIGYAINVYQLNATDIAAATGTTDAWAKALQASSER